jgi:hypothetical protein
VDRILREQRRLEAVEESTTNDLHRIQQELSERLARLARLRRQKRLLMDKGKEMVRRNLENLDELEAEESLEAVANNVFNGVDWNTVDFSSLGPADLGASGGIVESAVDSVSSA